MKTFEKISAAGFTIIRTDDNPQPRIKKWVSGSAYITLEKDFPSKSARDRRFKQLLEDPMIVDL